MTLLVAWAGIDTHGPSSAYIASDSRISWQNGKTFDFGRKVFAFTKWPDILGYCGDVLFPSIALNQIVDLADAGLLFTESFSPKQKFQAIVDKLNDLFRPYPQLGTGIAENSLGIVHCSRDPVENKKFVSNTISWSQKRGWYGEEATLPVTSDVLFALGSGAQNFLENRRRYADGPTARTSRSVFHCFCDVLAHPPDSSVGGAPQLVGLFRKPSSVAMGFGIIHERKRYFLGAHIDNLSNFEAIEWRNSNFELCNGHTMAKFSDAQPRPDKLRRL